MTPKQDQHCLFCPTPLEGKRTKEHIIPQWLQRELGIAAVRGIFAKTHKDPPVREIPLSQLTIKKVCAECNNGWLSELETQVQRMLTPLLRNKDPFPFRSLNWDDRHILSRWCAKTALLHDAVRPRHTPIPTLNHLKLLRGHLPDGLDVFALDRDFEARFGALGGGELEWGIFANVPKAEFAALTRRAFRYVLQLGRFAFVVAICPDQDWMLAPSPAIHVPLVFRHDHYAILNESFNPEAIPERDWLYAMASELFVLHIPSLHWEHRVFIRLHRWAGRLGSLKFMQAVRRSHFSVAGYERNGRPFTTFRY